MFNRLHRSGDFNHLFLSQNDVAHFNVSITLNPFQIAAILFLVAHDSNRPSISSHVTSSPCIKCKCTLFCLVELVLFLISMFVMDWSEPVTVRFMLFDSH